MILHNQNEASEGVFIDNLPRNVPYSIHLDSTRPSENNQNLQNPTKRREPHTRTCEKQKTQETVIYSEEGGRDRERDPYPFGGVGGVGGGEAEAVDVGGVAVNGAEFGEGEIGFGGRDGVASVLQHLQRRPSRQVVSVTLYAPFLLLSTNQTTPSFLFSPILSLLLLLLPILFHPTLSLSLSVLLPPLFRLS